jgi:hypothetical protein
MMFKMPDTIQTKQNSLTTIHVKQIFFSTESDLMVH